ncbi:transmembrane protein 182 [Microplitis demolitor]|uniref:transmembrane protein 182 n=1 Tax=Microplitis demolitor TaxID=69319 RepID=UPI0004CCD6B3|nr:transmembrane protein 182 [Microplitis demolitor]
MGKSKTGKTAAAFTLVGFIFIIIAFTTPYWLQTDGKLKNPKFHNLGLWQVCFKNFEDTYHLYDTKFSGCWWVFEEEYYIIHKILLPGFFVTTQFFFTLSFTLMLVGSFLAALYMCCSRQHDKYLHLLWAMGTNLCLSGFCGIIAVIVFGMYGDGRDWMPNWEHNDIGWSFALGVVGSFANLAAGILFLIEGRRHRKRTEKILIDEPRAHHTNI